jgi:thioredoxin reductase
MMCKLTLQIDISFLPRLHNNIACISHMYRGKRVLVVGGGDAAMEDALVLARTSEVSFRFETKT